MKILVTGGLGFVGSHIVNRYLSEGHEVIILDSNEETANKNRIKWNENVKLIEERIESFKISEYLNYMTSDVDLVINSAAETHVDYSFDRPMDFINANIIGLHNLVQFCIKTKTPIVHLSTDEVIGTGEDLYEDSMLKPTNPYAFTKCAGENLLHAYGYCSDLNWKVVRLNNIYGKMQFPDKLIPKFIYHILDGKKLPLHGDGEQTRNFLNVDDFVDALQLVITDGKNRNIYNVSTSEEYPIIEVTKMLCETMSINPSEIIEYVEDRPFNDPCYHSKNDKLLQLGWKPKYTLKGYLSELVDWYKNNREMF
jgi:dTDP-glucose 4,6-dehydratase